MKLHGIISSPVPIKNFRCQSSPMDLHFYTFWNDEARTNSISTVCVKRVKGHQGENIKIIFVNISYKKFKFTSDRAGDAFKVKDPVTGKVTPMFADQMFEKHSDPNTKWDDCWELHKKAYPLLTSSQNKQSTMSTQPKSKVLQTGVVVGVAPRDEIWSCSACTFFNNQTDGNECEMCGTSRILEIPTDPRVPMISNKPKSITFKATMKDEMKLLLKEMDLKGVEGVDNLLDVIIEYSEPVQEWLDHKIPVLLGNISKWLKGDIDTTDENYEALLRNYHKDYLMCGWGGPNWCWDYHKHYNTLKRVGGSIQSRNYTRNIKLIAKIDKTVIFSFIEYDRLFRSDDVFSHLCVAQYDEDEWFMFDHSTNLPQRIKQIKTDSSHRHLKWNNVMSGISRT